MPALIGTGKHMKKIVIVGMESNLAALLLSVWKPESLPEKIVLKK